MLKRHNFIVKLEHFKYCDKKMMYLGIFVFAACTAFGLVQCEKVTPFVCPLCTAQGENADSECDASIVTTPCPSWAQTDPIRGKGRCDMVRCNTSGCKAEYPTSAAPFTCPVCYAEGENAGSECEANIVNKPCFETDPVCVLFVSRQPSPQKLRGRLCTNREYYNSAMKDHSCDNLGFCANVAMCDTTGCKAEFPTSA